MEQRARLHLARQLMDEFAITTGLTGAAPPHRYLWTDAFAVCNFLGLHHAGGEGRDLDRALQLVDQVHHVLGRHRQDDRRQGWISGLAAEEGERHPTRGGLRIGKSLPERRTDEPFDARLEWHRDGQYFHYLTQWMHALFRVGQDMGQQVFHRWAVELAQAAHAGFTRSGVRGGPPLMVWKMSIDLSRVLVPSMGQHDPLDAWLAYLELEAGARAAAPEVPGSPADDRPILAREIAEAAALCAHADWATDDPLGIGAILTGIFRLASLEMHHGVDGAGMMARLQGAARISLEAYMQGDPLRGSADTRLAFRELGLAIGLHALRRVLASDGPGGTLACYLPLADDVDNFWSDPEHRRTRSWSAHSDINAVMLATSLVPQGFLGGSEGGERGAMALEDRGCCSQL